jgi:hypothetical protein
MMSRTVKITGIVAALITMIFILYFSPKSEVAYNTRNLTFISRDSDHELVKLTAQQ